jgi:hypothetical protein
MRKRRFILLAVLAVFMLSIRRPCAQGAPANGLYEIISGRYTECCGIGGWLVHPLPNAAQRFIELIIDPQRNVAQLTFLAPDLKALE